MNRATRIFAICLLLVGSQAFACAVPVFRYALENWEPDDLIVAILHDGPMSESTKLLVEKLEAATEADERVNLRVHTIDVAAEHPKDSAEAFHARQWRGKDLPHMLVYFGNDAPEPQLAWSAKLNESNVDRLLSSPARTEVVKRLLDGQTAVWVLLKTGRKEDDAAAEATLRTELAKKPNEIELPSLTDLQTEEKFNEELPVEMRVEFSVVTIDPDDEEEQFFREMLLSTESDLRDYDEPIAIPIYGRGRTYFALVNPGITADNISDNCNFICGACSCEVKRDNPGQDLLLAANWNQVEPGNWVNDTPLPDLIGIGGFGAVADVDREAEGNVEDASPANVASGPRDADPLLVASVDHPATSARSAATDAISAPAEPAGIVSPPVAINTIQTTAFPAWMLMVWILVLLVLGISFTFWRRRHATD